MIDLSLSGETPTNESLHPGTRPGPVTEAMLDLVITVTPKQLGIYPHWLRDNLLALGALPTSHQEALRRALRRNEP